MSSKNQTIMTISLVVILVLMGGAAVLKGGLYIGKHEGDMLHLMQIVFRMERGELPHLDFMTPIGVLAFWPIAMLVKAGFGVGMAVIWAQILTALAFLPMIVWVTSSRLRPWLAGLFGLMVMVLLLALVHGEAERSVSISMHYNRLAWAAAFVGILTALIPPSPARGGTVDGVIIGVMVCLMALIKMTYFMSFAAPILIALILTKQHRALLAAVFTGVAVILGVTFLTGAEFWFAYAQDLITVARSDVRAAPGEPLSAIMGAPAYLGGSLCLIACVILLRQAKVATGGLVLLLLVPGFFYVTFQNYGNDPQWLLLLAVLVLALRDEAADIVNRWGWKLKDALGVMAAIAFALTVPSFFNLAYSPFRHLNADAADFAPILPDSGIHTDLNSYNARVNRLDARVALDGVWDGLSVYPERDPNPSFMGTEFELCSVELGLPRIMGEITRDLEEAGLAEGKSLFAADIFSSHWLFGELEPMKNGAPWYYGGLPGFDDADYLMVPMCPVVPKVRAQILESVQALIDDGEMTVTELRRTDFYVLYGIN